ncbi:MAG: NAD(P)H-dependent oxidoreductase subunit E [Armatimonadota bacterium]|nr:NAD(P)H-dependent oxidoreductase subunit E [Armatimonadota bacterium]MDR7444667.1 NAD(P)H-dependent oxidoreductase subunit E [Armatimonadota bacterium]MDR7569493.1 NAD(P)H-dependent oxidoreductase subunit E [Armatimonadota bacterium]MDR7613624.1 NAD(P)H-dependent oxidoreductase subunit E [Armatimonadota bacterium]
MSAAPLRGWGVELQRLEHVPPPTPEEQQALERVWGHLRPEERVGRRDLLLPALWAVQEARGWISYPAAAAICRELGLPVAEVYGVASFYALLATEPRPPRVIHLCDDIACMLRGAEALAQTLYRHLGSPVHEPAHGETYAQSPLPHGPASPVGSVPPLGWSRSPCLGQCDRGAAALVGEGVLLGLTPEALEERVRAWLRGEEGPAGPASPPTYLGWRGEGTPLLLARCDRVVPTSLEDYRAAGGYRGLERALEIGPEATIQEVERSGLIGRGGAAFPTGRKWALAAREAPPRYVVCNADESEPGTFKDRVLLEKDPFAVIEGLTIAGYAVGAERGYIYVRGEYPEAFRTLMQALEEARAAGYLGERILGTEFSFDIEVRRGAGAYVCGEETALFNSIEGFRGEPRNRPPFPTQVGLFRRPTVINNVETLASVPSILVRGGAWYAGLGTERSKGTKLVCVSGHVARPGVYEVTFGTPIRTVLEELAGGVPGGRRIRAVLCGGAAGTFLRPEELDTPLAVETLQAIGATLGSGALVVFDERADLWAVVERIARFFREESCGQCVPCRVGTQRQLELVAEMRRRGGRADPELRALLEDLAQVMRDASICGLGQLAPNAVLSSLRFQDRAGGVGTP